MHLIDCATDIPALGLEAGKQYYCQDAHAGLVLANEHARVIEHIETTDRLESCQPGTKVLIIRPGGFGDLLLMTPVLQAMIDQGIDVFVATFPRYFDSLRMMPARVLPYPVSEETWNRFDRVVNFEGTIEGDSEEARTTHMTDLFASHLGFQPHRFRPFYEVTEEQKAEALAIYPRIEGRKRIGIQAMASARCRTWPPDHLQDLSVRLLKAGYEVFIFGERGAIAKTELSQHPLFHLLPQDPRLNSFEESTALLATMDAFVGPDSALTHVAGALIIPTVALYGPFPADLRVRYSPSIRALTGRAPCAPCFHHATPKNGSTHFPADGPCRKSGKCEALDDLSVSRVFRHLEEWLEICQSRQRKEQEKASREQPCCV